MRKQVPLLIATVAGVLMLVQFFVPTYGMVRLLERFNLYVRVISGFAVILGVASLMRVNWIRVKRRAENWPYGLVTIGGFVAMFAAGTLGGFWVHEGNFGSGIDPEKNLVYGWLFNYVFTPMDATIFALLGFYIASAAFRCMRAKDITAGLLLTAAILVILGRAPLTAWLWDTYIQETYPRVSTLGGVVEWLMNCPNTAAQRAIVFGASLAALAQAVRILVGIERPYMAGTGE
jgi:hypothetical protein